MTVVLIGLMAIAGGLGAATRFTLDGLIRGKAKTVIPAGTVIINVSGSLLIGFLTGVASSHGSADGIELILGTGFLGGYTTFSTASVETVRLVESRRLGLAATNALGTAVLTILAAAAGLGLWALIG